MSKEIFTKEEFAKGIETVFRIASMKLEGVILSHAPEMTEQQIDDFTEALNEMKKQALSA